MIGFIKITLQIGLLYFIFKIGEWIGQTFDLVIPGSVLGMMILFLLLITKAVNVNWIEAGAKFMIKHLTFFFIPVTVGIMNYFDLFVGKGILLVLITIASTIIVMITSGYASQWIISRKEANHD